MTTDTTEHTLESLTEQIPWIRRIKKLPHCVKVETSVELIEMDTHVHTLTNHGLTVERIRYSPSLGMVFYCMTDS